MLPYLFGEHNSHLNHIEKALGIDLVNRGNTVTLNGQTDQVTLGCEILESLWDKISNKQHISTQDIDAILRFTKKGTENMSNGNKPKPAYGDKTSIKTHDNQMVSPRSPNQAKYIDAIRNNDMVFGVGPAGTGKTFLAVASAVSLYKAGEIERMIFCRPAVEAGERLGFLPGDMLEKIDPYLRPIYDALHEMMPGDQIPKKMASGDIEIAPLAFMRGRTLKNAFVVLDEAQNTTSMQMKMFLTRMGEGTRMVITGDPSQIDLPPGTQSGLKEAMSILHHVDEVPFIHFDSEDVVRHKLVTKIIDAYDKYEYRSRS